MSVPTELVTRNMKKRGLLLGISSLIMSLSVFLFALPHFAIPSVGEDIQDHLTNISIFCRADFDPNAGRPRVAEISDWMYYFTALTFFCGASMLPIWVNGWKIFSNKFSIWERVEPPSKTTGYAIIEKETDEKRGTRNIAFVNIFGTMFGPVAGLVIGSLSISFWVEPAATSNINLTPEDPNWIGAWWIPYLCIGGIGFEAILISIIQSKLLLVEYFRGRFLEEYSLI